MQLRCRNSKKVMESLKTKDKINIYPFLKVMKNRAKSDIMAQLKCHVAQLEFKFSEGRVPRASN